MRFGCCVGTRVQIDVLARAGFEFCELPAAAVHPFDDDAAALPFLRELERAPLRPNLIADAMEAADVNAVTDPVARQFRVFAERERPRPRARSSWLPWPTFLPSGSTTTTTN